MTGLRPLAPELAEVARTQLNESEDEILQQLETLRTWILEQPHLKARTEDQFLLAFLRFCKYNLEATKERLIYYYTYKSSTAVEMFKGRPMVDDAMLVICRSGILATLPNPVGPGGPRIHFTRMGKIDTSIHTVINIFRFHSMRSEIEINTDDNWNISGVLEIIDFSKIPFSIIRQFEPSLFKKMAAYLEYGIPTNLVGTHIVNASREAQLMLGLVRLCMKQKELLYIHSNLESLQKAIGKEYLPTEYGGSNGSLDEAIVNFEKLLLEYEPYFIEDAKYGVDEASRQGDKAHSNMFNSSEALRTLDFD